MVGEDDRFLAFEHVALSPVGLVEDPVDVFDVDDFGLSADSFEHATEAEVFGGTEVAVADFVDEVEGSFGEGVVWQSGPVELVVDEGGDIDRGEGLELG